MPSRNIRVENKAWKDQLQREEDELHSLTGEEREKAEKSIKDRRVHPVDAPRGSLRTRLLSQMTATESSSKTAASNLMYNLCSSEGTSIDKMSGRSVFFLVARLMQCPWSSDVS